MQIRFPNEIWHLIFLFDPTYHHLQKTVIEEFKMKMKTKKYFKQFIFPELVYKISYTKRIYEKSCTIRNYYCILGCIIPRYYDVVTNKVHGYYTLGYQQHSYNAIPTFTYKKGLLCFDKL